MMKDKSSAAGILESTIEKVKDLVNVSTIIGEPIKVEGGVTIIPVSKVTYGFASGGSDFPTKKEAKDCFGGGSGAGVSIVPVAFLVVYKGDVQLVSLDKYDGAADRVVGMVPELIDKVSEVFGKGKKKKSASSEKEVASDDELF